MSERVILHCDCNSFFASVETVLNPAYAGVPMAVCGSEEDRHGIVLAKNELAKKYGIQTAETVYSAKRKCPSLVIAEPHRDEYVRFSRRVNDIYLKYTDLVEPFGIDESWLDVTASQRAFGTGETIADRIRQEVKQSLGITVSVGVSFNKVFAKLGSDYKKPDATTVINRENFKNIVFPLPASDLLFVGKRTSEELRSLGIRTIGDIALTDEGILKMRLGKMGEMLHRYANGLDDSPVSPEREDAKSMGAGFTFRHDLVGKDECRIGIEFLSEEIGTRLRRHNMKCTAVQLTIKDEYLRSIQRQKQLGMATDISREIADAAYRIMLSEWSEHKPVRMITVTAIGLVNANDLAEQIDIFGDNNSKTREKSKKREETVDKIRQKYGFDSIVQGAIIDSDIGIYEKKDKK